MWCRKTQHKKAQTKHNVLCFFISFAWNNTNTKSSLKNIKMWLQKVCSHVEELKEKKQEKEKQWQYVENNRKLITIMRQTTRKSPPNDNNEIHLMKIVKRILNLYFLLLLLYFMVFMYKFYVLLYFCVYMYCNGLSEKD